MDISKWVTDAERELALTPGARARLGELIARLPGEVTDDHHGRADATVAEAFALAQAEQLPWIEVFVRHWHLKSRVFRRHEGRRALADAVSLVELAHRDDTSGCPQAVCALRDLCACQGRVDGPGYAPERLAVSRDALARIDATWPCFECLSGECADALVDQGRSADAIAFLDQQIAARAAAGQPSARARFGYLVRADALLELGMADEALALLAQADQVGRDDAGDVMNRRLRRARALAMLGDHDASVQIFPGPTEIGGTPAHYRQWVLTLDRLVRAEKIPNEAQLGGFVRGLVLELERLGVLRHAVEIAGIHGHLALLRGAHHVAVDALAIMERLLPQLRGPLDAPAQIERLRAAIAATPRPEVELPDDPSDVTDFLNGSRAPDAEAAVIITTAALERWPAHPPLVEANAVALHRSGFAELAMARLRAALVARPGDPHVMNVLGAFLRAAKDEVGTREMAEGLLASADPTLGHWLLAQWHADRAEDDEAMAHLAAILAVLPDALNTRRLWAQIALRRRDWATMLAMLDEVVAREPKPGGDDWNRMIAASVLERWDAVRHSARRLGLVLPDGDGPVELDGGAVRVRYDDDTVLYARRTGPVTATIVEIGRPGSIVRYDDRVVFDARPLNDAPETDEEPHTWLYAVVETVARGGARAFSIDGVKPDAEAWAALRAIVEAHGGVLQVTSGEPYRLVDPRSGKERPAIFARVATKGPIDALYRALNSWRGDRVLVWTDLAAAANDPDGVAAARIVEQAWGIV